MAQPGRKGHRKGNSVLIDGDTIKIYTTKGEVILADAADEALLKQYTWCVCTAIKKSGKKLPHAYAPSGKTMVKMHRLLMGNPSGYDIDHIDGNGLNNHRSNLRIATRAQNMQNAGVNSKNTSGYKGVVWVKAKCRWDVLIRVNGKRIRLGSSSNKDEAARIYNQGALKYHKEFAYLNHIEADENNPDR